MVHDLPGLQVRMKLHVAEGEAMGIRVILRFVGHALCLQFPRPGLIGQAVFESESQLPERRIRRHARRRLHRFADRPALIAALAVTYKIPYAREVRLAVGQPDYGAVHVYLAVGCSRRIGGGVRRPLCRGGCREAGEETSREHGRKHLAHPFSPKTAHPGRYRIFRHREFLRRRLPKSPIPVRKLTQLPYRRR